MKILIAKLKILWDFILHVDTCYTKKPKYNHIFNNDFIVNIAIRKNTRYSVKKKNSKNWQNKFPRLSNFKRLTLRR